MTWKKRPVANALAAVLLVVWLGFCARLLVQVAWKAIQEF